MNESVLDDLVSQWRSRRAAGEEVSLAELCQAHPTLLPELQRRLDGLAGRDATRATPDITPQDPANSTLDAGGVHPEGHPPVAGIWPSIPGYEVLGDLGRGGMGVVYRARQLCLDRTVALKVILSAEFAHPEERRRFQAEAEAVARLQHPNIVQVYEVGEHNGLPYFSMEYCGGGNLSRKLGGQSIPAADAAALVETLARAVQVAHTKGLIHRDLKPANVLLTEDGTLKLTDFGLAKRVGEASHTRTGNVLGTPSYMAPEQANGEKDIGPAADIYALGVILYECLTGRPPFQGNNVLETMRQVTDRLPKPPSHLQPQTPRTLEAICLKCLNKKPGERHSSALELADQLQRFREEFRTAPAKSRLVHSLPRRTQWLIAAGVLAVVGGVLTMVLLHPPSGSVSVPDADAQTSVALSKPVQVLKFEIHHYPTVNGHSAAPRLVGKESFTTHRDDRVTVAAQLSRPAYAFLIAFRPDGTDDVCFPEQDDQPPPSSDRPCYPSVSHGDTYALEEGTGLEAFALVVSREPLPSYKEWRSHWPASPWHKTDAPADVVWKADGVNDVEALTTANLGNQRGKHKAVEGRTPIAQLADWLRRLPQVEAVEVIGFRVQR